MATLGHFSPPKKLNPLYEFAAPFLLQSCKNSPPKTNSAWLVQWNAKSAK
jgi:hypothetical protein